MLMKNQIKRFRKRAAIIANVKLERFRCRYGLYCKKVLKRSDAFRKAAGNCKYNATDFCLVLIYTEKIYCFHTESERSHQFFSQTQGHICLNETKLNSEFHANFLCSSQ